jgi:hypothetical protein
VSCSAGYTMTGGGAQAVDSAGTPAGSMRQSYPSGASTWTCDGGTNACIPYAICCH